MCHALFGIGVIDNEEDTQDFLPHFAQKFSTDKYTLMKRRMRRSQFKF